MNKYKVSERMKALADYVIPNQPAADIGTDHGFVPIHLITEKICPYVVMTDVNEGPVEKAFANLRRYEIDDSAYDLRLGDGLIPLKNAEVDTVIIAGMGGENIIDILKYDLVKSKSFKRFVLQPRKRAFMLRDWLYNNGFIVKQERIVYEAPKYCEIIMAEPTPADIISEHDNIYLPEMLYSDPLFKEYLDEYIRKVNVVIDNMTNSKATSEIIKPWKERLIYAEKIKAERF